MMGALRVGIDGFNLALVNGTGVATYARTLAQVLGEGGCTVEGVFGLAAPERIRLREILFFEELGRGRVGQPLWRARWARAMERFSAPKLRPIEQGGFVERSTFADRLPALDRIWSSPDLFERAERHFRRTRRLLEIRLPDPPQIMHWTYPLPVRLAGARNVYTLHDLVPLKLPYTTLDRKRTYLGVLDAIATSADHICTVSEHSRADIIAMLGVDASRVTNTWQSAPSIVKGSEEDDVRAIRGVFGLEPRSYFLYYGAIEPKKNIGRIVEAYLSLDTQTPLVIVGARAWAADEELRLLRVDRKSAGAFGRALDRRIVELGYLPRTLLMKLVGGAKAVVFPSLYEGFGLPVLEAMEAGTPVVTSAGSSLTEVAGDAALTVNPYRVDDIASAMRRIDEEPDLAADLGRRGKIQAARFSKNLYRDRLREMYQTVMNAAAPAQASR
jgi:glycosyltransferase involved in cell wall biosynthesis